MRLTMDNYEPEHLVRLRRWDSTIPRFLFRGFNEHSGGDKNLNTHTAITPHAFLTSAMDMNSGKPIESGPPRLFYPPIPTTISAMSLEQFRSEINRHLYGKTNFASHFSSWTADFETAARFAWESHGPPYHDPYIGILDTSRRDHGNVILHVRALRNEGHTAARWDNEYLVYGPVKGIPYTCLAELSWQYISLFPPLYLPLYTDWSAWPFLRKFHALSRIREAHNKATRHSFYHAAGAANGGRWGSCPDTALYLTIIAAEWSRDATSSSCSYRSPPYPKEIPWQELVSDLSQVMERAALDATLVLPLVNPQTHQEGLPELKRMITLLLYFEAEITRLRSKPPRPPQPWSWSLARFFWGALEAIKFQIPTLRPRARRNDTKGK